MPKTMICMPSRPVPMVMINGASDPVVPYGGGTEHNVSLATLFVAHSAKAWAKIDRRAEKPERSKLPARAKSGMETKVGGINANEVIWSFLVTRRLPGQSGEQKWSWFRGAFKNPHLGKEHDDGAPAESSDLVWCDDRENSRALTSMPAKTRTGRSRSIRCRDVLRRLERCSLGTRPRQARVRRYCCGRADR